jgi:CRP-like cAMP-binding protein
MTLSRSLESYEGIQVCDVLRTEDGREEKLAELGPGEYFGEMALLTRSPRAATIRCTEAMDVLSVRKGELGALMAHLPALRDSFEQVMAQRRLGQ